MHLRDLESVTSGLPDQATAGAFDAGPRIDRLAISRHLAGAVEGEGRQSLMIFYHDRERLDRGPGEWVGLDLITGTVDGRAGTFAVRQRGRFTGDEGERWSGTAEVVPGSGTGDLEGLSGEGKVTILRQEPSAEYSIRFTIE